MLAEEDKNAEEKSLDEAWYKRKHNNSGEDYYLQNQLSALIGQLAHPIVIGQLLSVCRKCHAPLC